MFFLYAFPFSSCYNVGYFILLHSLNFYLSNFIEFILLKYLDLDFSHQTHFVTFSKGFYT